jgi:hypothetical protein
MLILNFFLIVCREQYYVFNNNKNTNHNTIKCNDLQLYDNEEEQKYYCKKQNNIEYDELKNTKNEIIVQNKQWKDLETVDIVFMYLFFSMLICLFILSVYHHRGFFNNNNNN